MKEQGSAALRIVSFAVALAVVLGLASVMFQVTASAESTNKDIKTGSFSVSGYFDGYPCLNLGTELSFYDFVKNYNCNCDHVCIENPVPMHICDLPYPTQVIQPYFFGDPFSKKTYLWTKGLPKLVPTDICESFVPYLSVCSSSKKMRSKTFPGIANAFAHQFSAAILSGNSFSLPYQTFLKDVIL